MDKLKVEQALGMLRLQDKMNATVNPDWLNAGYPFLRAVVVEVGEALDHYGWKWWKKQQPDLEQVQIELIDILHFMLSETLIESNGDHEAAARLIVSQSNPDQAEIVFDGKQHGLQSGDTRQLLELLGGLAVSRRNSFPVLEACFGSCGMDWGLATRQYVSKNVLNIFRQNHGYKEGTYLKEWDGREDNVHLVEIGRQLDPSALTFADDLYAALERKYETENQKQQMTKN